MLPANLTPPRRPSQLLQRPKALKKIVHFSKLLRKGAHGLRLHTNLPAHTWRCRRKPAVPHQLDRELDAGQVFLKPSGVDDIAVPMALVVHCGQDDEGVDPIAEFRR